MSRQSPNKNQLQELLLGLGIFLRDVHLACFTDHEETPVPDYIANSCMVAADLDTASEVLKSLSDFLNNDPGYVLLYNLAVKMLTSN